MFNEGHFAARAAAGEFRIEEKKNQRPASPNEPPEARSITQHYFDMDGNKIAVVHFYLRAKGEIGASGQPDPKLLLVDGIVHVCDVPARDQAQPPQGSV